MIYKNMRRTLIGIVTVICASVSFLMTGCEKDPATGLYVVDNGEWMSPDLLIHGAVSDVDGNLYDAVELGTQVWTVQNMKTLRYADSSHIGWSNGAEYSLVSEQSAYGCLYNWAAVMGDGLSNRDNSTYIQGVCPDGWHIPYEEEWKELLQYVGSQVVYTCNGNSAHIAKSLSDTAIWKRSTATYAVGNIPSVNNATGFSALPAGKSNGAYFGLSEQGTHTYFWCVTSDLQPAFFHWGNDDCEVQKSTSDTDFLYSVRCVRDK